MSFWATHKPYLKDVDSTQHTRKLSPCEPLECRLRQGSRTHCTVPYRNSIVNYYSICCLSITYSSPFCVLLIYSFWGAKNEQKYATGRYIFKWNCTGANLSTKSFKNRTFTRPDSDNYLNCSIARCCCARPQRRCNCSLAKCQMKVPYLPPYPAGKSG